MRQAKKYKIDIFEMKKVNINPGNNNNNKNYACLSTFVKYK